MARHVHSKGMHNSNSNSKSKSNSNSKSNSTQQHQQQPQQTPKRINSQSGRQPVWQVCLANHSLDLNLPLTTFVSDEIIDSVVLFNGDVM